MKKIQTQFKTTDESYKQEVASAVGCSTSDLESIVGPDEFNELVPQFESGMFYPGELFSSDFNQRFKNIKDNFFRINLHTHTTESDGLITIEKLLDTAACYADKVASKKNDDLPAFTIAVSNHDSVGDCQKAVKIIAANPEKYKNIKFVPSVEFSIKLDNSSIFKRPVTSDLLGYAINPFDYRLNNFLKNLKHKRFNEAEILLKDLKKFGIEQSLEEIKSSHPLVKIGGSMGFFDFIRKHIEKKHCKDLKDLHPIFKKFQIDNSPTIRDIYEELKNSYGILGLAHPARIYLYTVNKNANLAKRYKNYLINGLYAILEDSYKQGARALETNYCYVEKHYNELFDYKMKAIKDFIQNNNLLKTGGTDSHRENIFTHHEDLSKEEISYLLGE